MYQEYGDKKVIDFVESDLFILEESSTIADAAREMLKKGLSSVLVRSSDTGKPIGIVTEMDILYRVVAENKSPFKTALKEIMSSPLISIDESTRVEEGVKLMRASGIRRLPVTHQGEMTGMLTLKTICGNSHEKKIELLDVELPASS